MATLGDGYVEAIPNETLLAIRAFQPSSIRGTVVVARTPTQLERAEHEASTSKIGEDQLFYLRSRGITENDATALIVNGFAKEVLQQLPMEFAVEAQKLLAVSLEGSVG